MKILHTWAWWLSSHWAHTIAGSKLIKEKRKKNKKPFKFHKQLQSPTGFYSLLKGIQSSLCSWNSSWAAGRNLLLLSPWGATLPQQWDRGDEWQGCTEHPNKAITASTQQHGPGWDIWWEDVAEEAFQGMCQAQVAAKGWAAEVQQPHQVLVEKENSPCPP